MSMRTEKEVFWELTLVSCQSPVTNSVERLNEMT